MSEMSVHGHCHCGQITLEATVDTQKVMACHCTDCQVISGAPYRAIVAVPAESLTIHGTPKEYVKTAESGNKRFQAFCGDCGTQLYAADSERTLFNIRLGCLDERAQLVPRKHIFGKSTLDWVHDIDQSTWFESGLNSPQIAVKNDS